MSKKELKQTNEKIELNKLLFPPSLVGKKLKTEKTVVLRDIILANSQEMLEEYLDTKNPEFLFDAIKEDNSILQGAGNNLNADDFIKENNKKKNNFVDRHTIVWESIRHWQNLHNWLGNKELVKKKNKVIEYDVPNEAKKYLIKIGSALIIKRESYRLYQTYGINHYTPTSKGVAEQINVEIDKCDILIDTWTKIESVIKPIRKKYKITSNDERNILIDELYKVIVNNLTNKLDIQIPIRKRDIKDFDLRTVNLTIASVLSHIHSEIHCEYCKKTRIKKISPSTIYKLYKTCIDPIVKHKLSLPK